MDTKKILVVVALMAMVATPAFAWGSKQVVAGNCAFVTTDVTAVSKTGGNEIINIASKGGDNDGSNTIKTGEAGAGAGATTVVNSNLSAGCCGKKQIDVDNHAFVMTDVTAVSKTGGNKIVDVATKGGISSGSNSITAGAAYTQAATMTVVNSNITRGFMFPSGN